jgi:hypothetical protein
VFSWSYGWAWIQGFRVFEVGHGFRDSGHLRLGMDSGIQGICVGYFSGFNPGLFMLSIMLGFRDLFSVSQGCVKGSVSIIVASL